MKAVPDLSGVAKVLQTELQRRFIKYTSPADEEHKPIMLAATALDVRYRVILNPVQLDSAEKMLLDQVCYWMIHDIVPSE